MTTFTMDDGRQFEVTPVRSKEVTKGNLWDRRPLSMITVWQAEYIRPVQKMKGWITREHRGFGLTPAEAIADCYRRLEDEGELGEIYNPCTSCGSGYTHISMSRTHYPHDEKCPALKDRENEDEGR